jgi:hypothetical protein
MPDLPLKPKKMTSARINPLAFLAISGVEVRDFAIIKPVTPSCELI